MKRSIHMLLLITTLTGGAYATENGPRLVIDVLLGFDRDTVVILQRIDDTSGVMGRDSIEETSLVIKKIRDKQLVMDRQVRITDEKQIIPYVSTGGFHFAVPKMLESRYLHLDLENKRAVYYFGVYYNLTNIIPKELWGFSIDKIEQAFDFDDHLLVVIDFVSKSGIELIRKVVLLK